MTLSREQGGKKMTVDWQLTSPFGDDAMARQLVPAEQSQLYAHFCK